MGQMAATLANRPQWSLPSNSEKNLKEQANAITLRSDKLVEQLQSQDTDTESPDMAKEDNEEESRKFETMLSNRQWIRSLNGWTAIQKMKQHQNRNLWREHQ